MQLQKQEGKPQKRRRIMNKKVSAFIAIALAAGTMVGCSSKSSSSASGEEGKVINVYSWNDEFRQRVEAVYPS